MKFLHCVLACVLAGALLTACGRTEKVEDHSLWYVTNKNSFVIGIDENYPPLSYRNKNGELLGYDVDLAQEVAKRLGVVVEFKAIDWAKKEQELASNTIDCIWSGYTITDERKKIVTLTKPYLRNMQVMLVKTESPITKAANLSGKTAGIQAGSESLGVLNTERGMKYGVKNIVEFADYDIAVADLLKGKIDALVTDRALANYNVYILGKPLRIVDETLGEETYGVAFRKGEELLANRVWGILLEMKADGTVAKIDAKWFGSTRDNSIISR